ncbi:MAG: hypothetical protein JXK07_16190 [Spirochaetes bacterium]|nr:hypothetical protein [Spirochaetota bacterium]
MLGNQQVTELFESGQIQAKRGINTPGDSHEKQADNMAEKMVQKKTNPDLLKHTMDSITAKSDSGAKTSENAEKISRNYQAKASA